MEHRRALVVAGDDCLIALEVAQSLVDVGAQVTIACQKPQAAEAAAERMTVAAAARAAPSDPDDAASAESSEWQPGCSVRPLDLSTPATVYQFADEVLCENQPLHVIINCADDFEPFYKRPVPLAEGGWESTTGRNHLGPLLLTQLLMDQVVSTMRQDAALTLEEARADGSARAAAAAARAASAKVKARRRRARRLLQRGRQAQEADADGAQRAGGGELSLRVRPYPAPLGRVVSLGLDARLPRRAYEDPPAVQGLFVHARNYTGWRAYRCAHEANTLASIQLAKMLTMVRVPTVAAKPSVAGGAVGEGGEGGEAAEATDLASRQGECIEVNVVRPSHARWLPRPLRRLLRTSRGVAYTATFLASTPISGISGLLFDDFETAPTFQQRQADTTQGGGSAAEQAARERSMQSFAAKQLYAASMSLIGSPPAQWRSEAAMMFRGYMASQRRRGAAVRGRSQPVESNFVPPPPSEEPPPPPSGLDLAQSQ